MLKINDLRAHYRPFLGARCGKICLALAFLGLFVGCRDSHKSENRESCHDLSSFEYSSALRIDTLQGERVAEIRSIIGADTLLKRFVFRSRGDDRPVSQCLEGAMVLQVPLKRVVVLSSAHIGYMLRLGLENYIIAVGEGKYIADSALYSRIQGSREEKMETKSHDCEAPCDEEIKELSVAEVGNGSSMDYERLLALKPDLVMTFATGGSEDDYERLNALGLPAMLTSEWQEESLLAKAEWLRLYGVLFGKEALVDSILNKVTKYFLSPQIFDTASFESGVLNQKLGLDLAPRGSCPRVLAGMSYGGVWYAPGGKSYTANLIKAAGGCYLWASDTTRELRLTIEDVIALADSADFWINPGMFSTPAEILAAEPRGAYIKAFKDKRVYQNDGRKGPGGGNDFFEGAVALPVELVENLKRCFGSFQVKSLPVETSKKVDSTIVPFEWYHNIF